MRQQGCTSTSDGGATSRGDDGWAVFSYLFGGVIVYGGLGWLLDNWLGTSFFVAFGVLGGMGLSLYLVYVRFWHFPDDVPATRRSTLGRADRSAGERV